MLALKTEVPVSFLVSTQQDGMGWDVWAGYDTTNYSRDERMVDESILLAEYDG